MIVQSPLSSALEAAISTALGFAIAYATSALALPALGVAITPSQNFYITVIMTVVSFIRTYAIRRLFNFFHLRRSC